MCSVTVRKSPEHFECEKYLDKKYKKIKKSWKKVLTKQNIGVILKMQSGRDKKDNTKKC